MKPLDTIGPIDVYLDQHVEWNSHPHKSPEKIETEPTSERERVDHGKEAERGKVKEIIDRLNRMRDLFNRRIHFEVSSDSNDVIVKILDRETGKIIRQIPSPELIKLASRMEEIYGIIFRGKR